MNKVYYRKCGEVRKTVVATFKWRLDAEKYLDELRNRVKSGFYNDACFFFIREA
jgi:hypothetical protein